MVNTVIGLDATHAEAHSIPHGTAVVYGYVSGTPDIVWTPACWSMFPTSRKIRIWQGYGGWLPPTAYDECDVEKGALQPSDVAHIMSARVAAGFQWTTFYGSRDYLAAVTAAGSKLPKDLWIGHANCRLADWSLNQHEAEALVGTMVEGMTCVAVQWASDTSNPETVVPGGTTTLRQTPMDINVVDFAWVPSTVHPAPPPPPPPAPLRAALVEHNADGSYSLRQVASTDAGTSWH